MMGSDRNIRGQMTVGTNAVHLFFPIPIFITITPNVKYRDANITDRLPKVFYSPVVI